MDEDTDMSESLVTGLEDTLDDLIDEAREIGKGNKVSFDDYFHFVTETHKFREKIAKMKKSDEKNQFRRGFQQKFHQVC